MIHFLPERAETSFQENLVDWCAGGPKKNGWTRSGAQLSIPKFALHSIDKVELPIKEVLAKNFIEVNKWHIDFLKFNNYSNWKDSLYFQEYLLPRYDIKRAMDRAMSFFNLYENVKKHGVQKPAWVALVDGLPFKYFRFDGCHRTCCASVCGMDTMTTIVFKTKRLN